MVRRFALLAVVFPFIAQSGQAQRVSADQMAIIVLDSAIARMGGEIRLRAVERVRLDVMTQWLQAGFSTRPLPEISSYERNVDLRDYVSGHWRNTRQFFGAPPGTAIISLVRDTVAALGRATANQPIVWGPLSVAYVVERRELFAFAPERLLLNARAASPGLLPDTVVDRATHARVQATVHGFPATIFIRRGDWTPTMVRFRADEIADFGLAPWGEMDVEFWFSGWRPIATGILYPSHWDVMRVGRPYKRMTVLAAAINPPATPDSFVIADSVQRAFFATQNKPMWDVPLDSARLVNESFATFGTPLLGSAGAVNIGGSWVLLETGQAPVVAERLVAALTRLAPGARIAGALVTPPRTANGGVPWLAARRTPIWFGTGARPYVELMLTLKKQPPVGRAIDVGRWQRVGTDSLWLESMDFPDMAGTLVAYSPTLKWAYSSAASAPVNLEMMTARLRARGFVVERYGSARGLTVALPKT